MWIIHEGLTRINSWMDLFRIPLDPPFSLQNELLITILPLPFPSHWNLKVRNIGKWTSISHMINENFQIKWFENMLCKKLKPKKIFHAQILFLSPAVPPDLRGTLKIWLIICSYQTTLQLNTILFQDDHKYFFQQLSNRKDILQSSEQKVHSFPNIHHRKPLPKENS